MNYLSRYFIVIIMLFFWACGGSQKQAGEEESEEFAQNAADTTLFDRVDESQVFIATTEVDDFDTWKQDFDSAEKAVFDSIFNDLTIHQGFDNPNMVVLTGHINDVESTRTFFSDRTYEMTYLDLKFRGNNVPETEYGLFVWHEVGDYVSWLEKFEGEETVREQNGLYCIGFGREMDKPQMVTLYFAVDNVEEATAYINPQLAQHIERAGVENKPVITAVKILK
ncbi:MAG: hypothetical protein RJQ09_09980 [Cyclobacteriaceae bacterium]